jgi:ferredoxin-type protein NapF
MNSRDRSQHARPKRSWRRRWRGPGRALCLVVAAAALALPAARDSWAVIVPAASPVTALGSLLATWTVGRWTLLGLAVGGVCLLRRRWFCRWACPTGLCADSASRLGLRLSRRGPSLPPVGQWLALATLAGAVAGYPLLLWLDPLALFAAAWGPLGPLAPAAAYVGLIALAAVFLASAIWPGVWCLRLCPLGGLQDALAGLSAALRASAAATATARKKTESRRLGLRMFVAGVIGVIAALAVRRSSAAASIPLRPPGACDESLFTGLCTRCGNCVRACPAKIVRWDLGEHGVAGVLTPTLNFADDYCREDCTRCTRVCPSGALTRLAPHEKVDHPIGLPRVDMKICLLGDDRECSICRNLCPYDAIRTTFSEEEYSLVVKVDAAKCPGCGACETACPTTPRKAIVVGPLSS